MTAPTALPPAPPTVPPASPSFFSSPLPSPAPLNPTPPKGAGGGWRIACAGLAAATLFAGGFAIRGVVEDNAATTATSATQKGSTVPVDLSATEPAAAVATALGPAVVQIENAEGLGSGVIYDDKGLILTNAHVVGSSRNVDVRLADGTVLSGRVLGTDTQRDVAVVDVESDEPLPVATLATGADPVVGSLTVAVGSPFGLQQTVTSGIVSAVDRPVEGTKVYIGMIQTDAPINPGNSGGALANRAGEVIGINSSIYSEDGENNGIGFAIPIDVALETANRLVAGDSVDLAALGVEAPSKEQTESGALIGKVSKGSAADKAGIEVGDRVVSIDDHPITTFEGLAVRISRHFPGDTVTVEVERDGKTTSLEVTLGARSSD